MDWPTSSVCSSPGEKRQLLLRTNRESKSKTSVSDCWSCWQRDRFETDPTNDSVVEKQLGLAFNRIGRVSSVMLRPLERCESLEHVPLEV